MKLDNGREYKQHTQIPRPIAKKLRETSLSERQRKLVDVIIEQTLGYESYRDDSGQSVKRTSKPLSLRYLSILTGIPKTTVERDTKVLVKRNILTQDLVWFRGQHTNAFGLNYDFWMWDKNGNFISKKEYKELRARATNVVESWLETHLNTDHRIVRGKRRDGVDLKVLHFGQEKYSVVVIPKPSWGEEFDVDKLKIPDNMPNTVFFFLNRDLTQLRFIEPSGYKDLAPTNPKAVIKSSGYIEVPNNNNLRGQPRIKSISLPKESTFTSPSFPYSPIPNIVRNDDSLKVPQLI